MRKASVWILKPWSWYRYIMTCENRIKCIIDFYFPTDQMIIFYIYCWKIMHNFNENSMHNSSNKKVYNKKLFDSLIERKIILTSTIYSWSIEDAQKCMQFSSSFFYWWKLHICIIDTLNCFLSKMQFFSKKYKTSNIFWHVEADKQIQCIILQSNLNTFMLLLIGLN